MPTNIRQSDRAFGLTFATMFAAIAGVVWLTFDVVLYWALAASMIFLVIALTVSWILLPLNRIWAGVGYRVGQVNNYVLLGLFFYFFVLPTGLILRLLGRDPMHRRLNSEARTYWTAVERQASETFQDMF